MSWTIQETIVFGSDTVTRERADGVVDFGHRVSVNGTPGDVVPVTETAINGDYRGLQPESNLQITVSPTLFDAAVTTVEPFGATTVVFDVTTTNFAGFNTGFAVATGAGDGHAWGLVNNGGADSGATGYIDIGGGPSDSDMATRFKTRIDAEAIAGLTVTLSLGEVTLAHADGVAAFSTDAGIVFA